MKRVLLPGCIIAVLLCLLCGCRSSGFDRDRFTDGEMPPQLTASDVRSMELTVEGKGRRELTEAEIDTILDRYNRSTVQIVDGAGTPDFAVTVTLANGTVFRLADAETKTEVSGLPGPEDGDPFEGYIFLVSDELYDFIKTCTEKDGFAA